MWFKAIVKTTGIGYNTNRNPYNIKTADAPTSTVTIDRTPIRGAALKRDNPSEPG